VEGEHLLDNNKALVRKAIVSGLTAKSTRREIPRLPMAFTYTSHRGDEPLEECKEEQNKACSYDASSGARCPFFKPKSDAGGRVEVGYHVMVHHVVHSHSTASTAMSAMIHCRETRAALKGEGQGQE
jgi:hypothetical protein